MIIMKFKLKSLSGFTLIEIMVVMGIFMLLFLVIYQMFLISNKAFTSGDQRLELIQNGRIILDRITRELRQGIEVVTILPLTKDDPLLPPPSEIIFQDGHDATNIEYLKYSLDNNLLKRERIAYYFSSEPETYVYWNSKDENNQPPIATVLEEKIIAEYLDNIIFYGSELVTMEIFLKKNITELHLLTSVWGRNRRQ